jgi:hypothetical protein
VLRNWVAGPYSPIEAAALVNIKEFARSLLTSRNYSMLVQQLIVEEDNASVSVLPR